MKKTNVMLTFLYLFVFITILNMLTALKIKKNLKSNTDSNDIDNSAFEDGLADEDRFDTLIKRVKPYSDLNSQADNNSEYLVGKLKSDLTGQKVNFDYE